jgi:putative transcriptional regulator
MSKKYRSDAMAAINETMEVLHAAGAVDKQTMQRFDDACLTPIRPLRPEEIKAIREKEHVSQTVSPSIVTSDPKNRRQKATAGATR